MKDSQKYNAVSSINIDRREIAHDYATDFAKGPNITGQQMIWVYRAFLAGYEQKELECANWQSQRVVELEGEVERLREVAKGIVRLAVLIRYPDDIAVEHLGESEAINNLINLASKALGNNG